ncbi:MAG TPA: NADH-quinone oxidoreductase subunit L, partial [Marinagarivorans sp.]|nr:NADH-quinone oxidoreductase subunit L [Marinagarivorans sp.]
MTLFDWAGSAAAWGLWGVLALPLLLLGAAHRLGAWRLAQWLGGAGLLLALALWCAALPSPLTSGVLRLGFVQASLLVLVSLLGWLIYRYGASNFRGDQDGPRFLRGLAGVLLAVQTLLLADHLLLFWAAWVMVSISLHQLLLFYPERPRARLAAHKKFLIARSAEALLALAIGLLYSQSGSFSLAANMAQLTGGELAWPLTLAALCLALVALLKCAQLPLHGWLIQVVEAPTPVSALLHAGVINLGGVLLLLFAPLISQVAVAQWLLLLVAAPSAVLAALIMTTRISVKVRLAWSTCAQMGLMLVECALGLYELALLHLFAHSCYKARAFLTAGSAVNEHQLEQLGAALGCRPLPQLAHWLGACALALPLLAGAAWVMAGLWPGPSGSFVPWLLLGLAFTSWAAQHLAKQGVAGPVGSVLHRLYLLGSGAATVSVLIAVYLGLKTAIALGLPTAHGAVSLAADLWVA